MIKTTHARTNLLLDLKLENYSEILSELRENPGCIGFHLCGSYQRNRERRYGLFDEQENPDSENVSLISAANEATKQWLSLGS